MFQTAIWIALALGLIGNLSVLSFAYRRLRKGNLKKTAFLCFFVGSLQLLPTIWWFCIGFTGHSEWLQRGGQLEMIGLPTAFLFSLLFSLPLVFSVGLLILGFKLRTKLLIQNLSS